MKKFFKLFAVALVAGCMFTACGEKENNDDNGGNNGGGVSGADGIHVTFLGQTWDGGFIDYNEMAQTQYGTACGYSVYKCAAEPQSEADYYPSIDGGLILANDETGHYYNSYWEETGYYADESQTTVIGDHAWVGSQLCGNMTMENVEFDATSMKTSFKVTIPMLNITLYDGVSDPVIDNEILVYKNVTLTASSK